MRRFSFNHPGKKRLESDITREIRAYLDNIFGGMWIKELGGLGSYPGKSDIIGCLNGRYVAIEVKTEKGKLSEKQELFQERVRQNGGIAFVARSVLDVETYLRGYPMATNCKTPAKTHPRASEGVICEGLEVSI